MAPPYLEKVLIFMEKASYVLWWNLGSWVFFLIKQAGSYLESKVSHTTDLTPQKGGEKCYHLLNMGII